MTEAIIVAIITGLFSFLGVWSSNKKTANLIEYKIAKLEEAQNKHNQVIERVYVCEDKINVLDERVKVANKRIQDLEQAEKRN